jgi:hypothetical protein
MIWDKSCGKNDPTSVRILVRIFTRRSYLEGSCDYRLTGDYAGKNGKYQTGPEHSRWYSQIEGVFPRTGYAADVRCLSDILTKMRISNS